MTGEIFPAWLMKMIPWFPVLRVLGSPIARGWPYSPWLAKWFRIRARFFEIDWSFVCVRFSWGGEGSGAVSRWDACRWSQNDQQDFWGGGRILYREIAIDFDCGSDMMVLL